MATDRGAVLFAPAAAKRIAGIYRPSGNAESLFVNAIAVEPGGRAILATSAGHFRVCHNTGHEGAAAIDVSVVEARKCSMPCGRR